jgi:peptidoglycan hydrolase-like protein with peptidoglycan-binding domain
VTLTPFRSRNTNVLAVVILLAIVAVALVPGSRTTTVAGEAVPAVNPADLTVVGLDLSSTAPLKRETRRPGDPKVAVEQVDADAAKIVFRNRGEQAARVVKLTVHVSKVWAPAACDGAGQASTSVGYDFALPPAIDKQRFPMTMSKALDRTMAVGVTDTLSVTIGEPGLGGTGWAWATSASVALQLDDGRTATTGEFVLMNSTEIDHTVALAKADLPNPRAPRTDRVRCVQNNMAQLASAAVAPGVHSPSIRTLLDRLTRLGYTALSSSAPGGNSGSAPAPPAKNQPPVDAWVAILGSLPDTTSPEQLQAATDALQSRLGVSVESARSGDYASLAPGYRVLFHDGGFSDGHGALRFCSEHGISSDNECAGRFLSHNKADYRLNCHFSDPAGAARCTRRQ